MDKRGKIVDGHMRQLAAQEAGVGNDPLEPPPSLLQEIQEACKVKIPQQPFTFESKALKMREQEKGWKKVYAADCEAARKLVATRIQTKLNRMPLCPVCQAEMVLEILDDIRAGYYIPEWWCRTSAKCNGGYAT